uniref:PID domain-containing protein n=1 Tax=Globodera pallida TaxID=36090 RepID=A0A183C786_GLOPA
MRAWKAGGVRKNVNGKQQQQQLAMRLCVCRSGLRAETCMGVTEYFAHRITWSAAPSQYPHVFCWIYKHEGKRMKPELRCHAVLCRRTDEPQLIHQTLRKHLQLALQEEQDETEAEDDEYEEELHLSDVDSLNISEHYRPMPTMSSFTDDRTTNSGTTDSCRSSACGEEDDDEHHEESVSSEQEQQQRQRTIGLITTVLLRRENNGGDDVCSADSGYSAHA